MIVVLDASTFVSAALKANSIPERALLRAVGAPNRLILSQEVEDEYRDVIFAAERVVPNEAVRECRDPADDKYLALAFAGRADVLVSSDVRDLLSMHPWRGIQILPPAGFLALP